MHITPFGVEIWMNDWETRCELNLAETCVASLTIEELLALSGRNAPDLGALLGMKMTYGAIEGSLALRTAVASLFETRAPENVVVTHGAIGANMLVHRTLVGQGDHVISIVPTYQQHHSIPESIGAQVDLLQLREEDNWLPDLDRLRAMCRTDTKLIALTNPNNPTGALIPREMLKEIVAIAKENGTYILCDEVYRGLDQDGGFTTSVTDLYERGISTGGMSKTYSLAGLRLGWIVASRDILDGVMIQRDYDTISVGVLDDHFATMALENRDRILDRSRTITRTNLKVLADWVESEPLMSFVRPKSGTTAFVKYDLDLSSRDFCIALLKETGVMFTPGSVLGIEGYVRIGFANSTEILREGLGRVSAFLKAHR